MKIPRKSDNIPVWTLSTRNLPIIEGKKFPEKSSFSSGKHVVFSNNPEAAFPCVIILSLKTR